VVQRLRSQTVVQVIRSQTMPRASGYAPAILALNPIHYWRMDETSGAISDIGSSPCPLSPSGSVTYGVSGALGGGDPSTAVQLSGAGFGRLTGAANVVGQTGFTIIAWVNGNGHVWGGGTLTEVIALFTGASKTTNLSIQPDGTIFGSCPVNNTNTFVFSAGSLPTTGWRQVVMTWTTGDSPRLYINGAADGVGPVRSGVKDPMTLSFVGVDNTGAAGFLTGKLDEVAILPVGLTAQQVADLYAAREL